MINAIKDAVAAAAKMYGAEGYEITIGSSTNASVEALKDEISSVTYEKSTSMTVRCVKGGKSGYASGNIVTPEEAAELVRRACDSAPVVDEADEVGLFAGSPSYPKVERRESKLPTTAEMIEHTLMLQKKLLSASDKVVDGSQSFVSLSAVEESFINSEGLDLSYGGSYVIHGVVAAVKDGDDAEENYEVAFIEEEDADSLVDRTVTAATAKLGGEAVESGKYSIILDSETMRSMLAVFSPIFSARSAFLKTTLFADKEGEMVANDVLTIVDDPFHPKKFDNCPFDAEGVACYTKNVIENGRLITLLYNRMYANKFGKTTTGNASSAKGISPRGLYIKEGTLSRDELLGVLGNGLYITELKGLHAGADADSGDFSLEAAGFLVENGVRVRAVKNITIADNFYSLLYKVRALADNLSFGTGGSYGAPDVLFDDISVSGK